MNNPTVEKAYLQKKKEGEIPTILVIHKKKNSQNVPPLS